MEQEDIISRIRGGRFTNPHDFLGLQEGGIIRLWRPHQSICQLKIRDEIIEARPLNESGLFCCEFQGNLKPKDYWIAHENGRWANDPYAFDQVLGELDVHLFAKGVHYKLYDLLGSTAKTHQGVQGMSFVVWAPNALSVLLQGEFNGFEGRVNPMRAIGRSGIWELFVPGVGQGERYLFEVITQEGEHLIKVDPVAHHAELRPKTASIAFDVGRFQWGDRLWLEERGRYRHGAAALSIYEVHLGSWKRCDGGFLNYRQLAGELAAYCKQMRYTHVELIGTCEHPLDESWGYQVTGYFAPTSRHGTPEDFQYFVDYFHQQGLGVIVDWVPAHFPTDPHSLCRFDGTHLYEHLDPRQGFHPHWNTHIFNYGRWEVSNFLLASALFWLEKMHVDGLRVDAVSSMLYLDYGRKPGEWIPNRLGSNINLEAVEFLKHLNSIIHKRVPDALMIAEESSAFPGVTRPVEAGGLGFDLKWNLGWMNDTLRFFTTAFSERATQLGQLIFAFTYAFDERFVLVLSHDEVVHEKRSLLAKMPGSLSERFAGLRNLLAFMATFPGKKLLFMGGEWGQPTEWNCKGELSWDLLGSESHAALRNMVVALNQFYLSSGALYERDSEPEGFEWVVLEEQPHPILAFLRKGLRQTLLCIHHFYNEAVQSYFLPLKRVVSIREVFNTDGRAWGGSGIMNETIALSPEGIEVRLAPLATHLFEVTF